MPFRPVYWIAGTHAPALTLPPFRRGVRKKTSQRCVDIARMSIDAEAQTVQRPMWIETCLVPIAPEWELREGTTAAI
jgi:hypothetical protein